MKKPRVTCPTFCPHPRLRVCKIDITVQPFFNSAPVGKFRAPVTSNGLDQLGREGRKHRNNRILHGFSLAVRNFNCNVKACLTFRQGSEAGLALALAAHDRIRFPVPGFFPAVHGFVPFANRLALTVFSSRFLTPVAFSLAPQYFQVPVY